MDDYNEKNEGAREGADERGKNGKD